MEAVNNIRCILKMDMATQFKHCLGDQAEILYFCLM